MLHAGVGAGFTFECDKSEGATLFLPDGASSRDLLNMGKFRAYAMSNGVSWYKHAIEELGRDVANGSIILVTGCDKAVSWGIASYRDESRSTAVRLNFTAAEVVRGSASFVYHWETSSPATVRIGPLRFDGHQTQLVSNRHGQTAVGGRGGPSRDQGNSGRNRQNRRRRNGQIRLEVQGEIGPSTQVLGDNDPESKPIENQCVFIRGYSISIQEKIWKGLFGESEVEVGLKKLQDAKSKNFDPSRSKNQTRWFGGGLGGSGGSGGSGVAGQNRSIYAPADVLMDSDSDDEKNVPESQVIFLIFSFRNHHLLMNRPCTVHRSP